VSPLLGVIFNLRQRACRLINNIYLQSESTFLLDILLGVNIDIPADLERAFQDTGMAHIIAIYG
jgi:competence protein ComEC